MLDIVLLILALPLATAQEIPDYDRPYAPIFFDKAAYSWTDKVKIRIVAPSWNTDRNLIDSIGGDASHPIKIATRDSSLEPYRLVETGAASGVFEGEVILTGFLHDADGDGGHDAAPLTSGTGPTGGFLETGRDSAVTVSFEFADGVVLSESVPVSWNVGAIRFGDDAYSVDDAVTVRVTDPDMNLNPEAIDQIPITVFSNSDAGGITASAIETSESSGSFVAVVSLTQNSASGGSRLYAVPGDVISAIYDDHTLPSPHSESDSMEVRAESRVGSHAPEGIQLESSGIRITDGLGGDLESIFPGQQVQIVGSLSNEQDFDQRFVYLFQTKDSQNRVVSLSWIQGTLPSGHSSDVSRSWTPQDSGSHTIETFVWLSLADPTPLSDPVARLVSVG